MLNYNELFVDGELVIKEEDAEQIMHLAEIVVNKHYSYLSVNDREELKAGAVLKAVELLKDNDFDESKSTLRNYLYTGMRNEASNINYRMTREYPREEFYCGDVVEDDFLGFSLKKSDYKRFINKFSLNEEDGPLLLEYLKNHGFRIDFKFPKVEGFPIYRQNKLVTLYFWDLLESLSWG